MRIDRVWAMPNKHTFTIKPIRKLIDEEMDGIYVDPFCGVFSPAKIRNDLNPDIKADYNMDALEFLRTLPDESCDGVFFDPPYSLHQAKECYKSFGQKRLEINITNMKYWSEIKNHISRIICINGKAICFGWNSMGIGKNRGFKMERILMVPHGGSRNDTIVTVEVKK